MNTKTTEITTFGLKKNATWHPIYKKCKEEIAKSKFFRIFAYMNETNTHWSENIIIADADYIDKVAFNLIVNFERMIGRMIPPADIAHWLDCIALDGGIREGENEIQVVLIRNKQTRELTNFKPSDLDDINGKAFKDHLGEFCITTVDVEDIITKKELINDVLGAAAIQTNVKRIMVIPDGEDGETYQQLRGALSHVDDDTKRITMFAMQPMPTGNYRQEILGYSMMAALGIQADEIR